MDWPVNAPLVERLLDSWQRGFPIQNRPFALVGVATGATEIEVIDTCADLLRRGVISRVGGPWAPGVGGAALLCAMAVPPQYLRAVAEVVSAHPGVNHNYEREHTLNLWFVATATSATQLNHMLVTIEQDAALPVLRMKMLRPYRINLGFDLRGPIVGDPTPQPRAPRVEPAHRHLAALVESGLPLVPEPFADWAAFLNCTPAEVLRQLQAWLDAGTLRRFGLVVRHHEVGFAANAMTVFDVPDDHVDTVGARLAAQPGVTLCYRRERTAGWRYNLYCMVHGRSREQTLALVQAAIAGAGLRGWPREVLFSRRRFKQTGSSYFR